MDKRFIFRSHQDRADGGTQEGGSSGPTGHGPWPVVAGFGWEIPRIINGEDRTKASVLDAGVGRTPTAKKSL